MKSVKKHDFDTKQCGLYGLKHFFSKNDFCYSPLQSSLKHHFFFKKTKILLFREKSVLSKRIPQKRLKKSLRSSKMRTKMSYSFPLIVRGVRLRLSIWSYTVSNFSSVALSWTERCNFFDFFAGEVLLFGEAFICSST